MIAYLDTSVLLRIVLREAGALDDLRTYDGLVSSELIAVESARTIDRLRNLGALTMDEAAERTGWVNEWLEAVELVLLRPPVLSRAMTLSTRIGSECAKALCRHAQSLLEADRRFPPEGRSRGRDVGP